MAEGGEHLLRKCKALHSKPQYYQKEKFNKKE
jgi:hypothetical protein